MNNLSLYMRIWPIGHILMSTLLLLCLMSCNDDTTIVCDYPEEQVLTPVSAETHSELYTAYAVSVFHNRYVFSKKGDCFLTLTDNDFGSPCEALRKGHGENEWLAPMLTGQCVTINGKELPCILERGSGVLYASDIEDSVPNRIQLVDLGKTGIPNVRNVFLLPDGRIVGQRDANKCEWFICNNKESKASVVDSDFDDALFRYNPQILSQGFSAYHEVSKTFVQTCFAYPMLYYLDEDCNVKKRIQLCAYMPIYNEKTAIEPFNYIVDLFSSKKYIYILIDSPEPDTRDAMHVLVFDWDANPIARLQINRSLAIAVDEKRARILAINEDDEKGCCSIYPFKEFH